jgi:hypothetical protein
MPIEISPAIYQRAAHIKLFLCDVDGVLTDGSIWRCPDLVGRASHQPWK